MAAPSTVQPIVADKTAVATTTLPLTWPVATTLGSRLMLVIAANDKDVVRTPTPLPAGGWTLVNPPGKITRAAAGLDKVSVWVYEIRNAAVQSGTKTITMDGACFFAAALLELHNDDVAVSTDARNSATGSAQTVPSGTTLPTSVAQALALAIFATGGRDAHSNLLPVEFAELAQVSSPSGGAASGDKLTMSIASRTLAVTGPQSASVDVAGGFNHNYVGMVLVIPGPSGGGGGGPTLVLPNTDDGAAHLACSAHYITGGIDTAAHAVTLANKVDIAAGQVSKFGTFSTNMVAANADILLMIYEKSAVTNTTDTFPESSYAHVAGGATPANRLTTSGYYIMQPDDTAPTGVQEGASGVGYKDWKQAMAWHDVDVENAARGGTPYEGVYLDSMGTSSLKTQVIPGTSTQYSATSANKLLWVELVRAIGDACIAARPGGWVWGNGLTNGPNYSGASIPTKGLLDHVHGAVCENWIRDNYSSATSFYGETDWQACVDAIIDANVAKGKGFWAVVNIGNDVPGNPPAGWSDFTDAQVEQWKRYAYCTFMLGNRGKAWFEFVRKSTEKPWTETHAYYLLALGAPLDSAASAAAMKVGTVYKRRYTNGLVLVSVAGGTYTADRDYQDPITGSPFLTGQTITLAANTGLMLVTYVATANPDAPVVTPTGPATVILSPATAVGKATATDTNGIAGVKMQMDGAAAVIAEPTGQPNEWSYDFGGLPPGAHTLSVTATDAHPTLPRSTTASRAFVVTLPNPPVESITISTDVADLEVRIKQRSLV